MPHGSVFPPRNSWKITPGLCVSVLVLLSPPWHWARTTLPHHNEIIIVSNCLAPLWAPGWCGGVLSQPGARNPRKACFWCYISELMQKCICVALCAKRSIHLLAYLLMYFIGMYLLITWMVLYIYSNNSKSDFLKSSVRHVSSESAFDELVVLRWAVTM